MAKPSAASSEVQLALLPQSSSAEQVQTPIWPKPQQLMSTGKAYHQYLLDVILGMLAFAYFIYGVVCFRTDGKPLRDDETWGTGNVLLKIAKYATTIFTYIFAATVSHCLKNIARWRSERGLAVGTMAQLLGSTSLGNTIFMPWKFRLVSPLMFALLISWALSPLGSQASLRIVSRESRNPTSPLNVTLLDINTPLPRKFEGDYMSNYNGRDLAFSAALAASMTTRNSSVDSWSNLYIPVIESIEEMENSKHDGDGWFRDIELDKIPHASLMGVPFTANDLLQSANFTYVAAYFHLTATNFTKGQYRHHSPGNVTVSAPKSTKRILPLGLRFAGLFEGAEAPQGPQTIFVDNVIAPWNTGSKEKVYISADFNLSMSLVEVEINRNATRGALKPWHMTAVRRKNSSTEDEHWTPLKNNASFYRFFKGMLKIKAFEAGNDRPSMLDYYLADPSNPYVPKTRDDFLAMSGPDYALRLAQIMNTFWIASLMPGSAILNDFNPSSNSNFTTRTAAGTRWTTEHFLKCHRPWLGVLLICSLFLMAAAAVSAICGVASLAPDVFDTVSSLTRKNCVVVPEGGTWMEGDERARVLKDVVVFLGDAKPDAAAGYIVLSNKADGDGKLGRLDRDRLYE